MPATLRLFCALTVTPLAPWWGVRLNRVLVRPTLEATAEEVAEEATVAATVAATEAVEATGEEAAAAVATEDCHGEAWGLEGPGPRGFKNIASQSKERRECTRCVCVCVCVCL
jgi:hypothetical protein